jgi:hypothetical protein
MRATATAKLLSTLALVITSIGLCATAAVASSWEDAGTCLQVDTDTSPAPGGSVHVGLGYAYAAGGSPACRYFVANRISAQLTTNAGQPAVSFNGPAAVGATWSGGDPYVEGWLYDSTATFDLRYDQAADRWAGTKRLTEIWRRSSDPGAERFEASPQAISVNTVRCPGACTGVAQPGVPAPPVPGDPNPSPSPSPRPNKPPVARGETWVVAPGGVVEGNVLDNDADPEGGALKVKVLSISFLSSEWSKMDTDGKFLYTAGPGTRVDQDKIITYEVIDEQGGRTRSQAVIKVRPDPMAARSPVKGKAHTSTVVRGWTAATPVYQGCFGRGLSTKCYVMLSVARTREYNALGTWTLTPASALSRCTKFWIVPLKPRDCARALLKGQISATWDKSISSNAAGNGDCLMWRIGRHRTLAHPLAGDWDARDFHPLHSVVRPYTGNTSVSGFGTWTKGITGRWRVPLFCDVNGLVHLNVGEPLRELS